MTTTNCQVATKLVRRKVKVFLLAATESREKKLCYSDMRLNRAHEPHPFAPIHAYRLTYYTYSSEQFSLFPLLFLLISTIPDLC